MPNPYNEDQNRNRNYDYHYTYNSQNGQNGQNDGPEPMRQTPRDEQQYHRGDGVFQIPWWVIMVSFFMGLWPISIAMLIINDLSKKGQLGDWGKKANNFFAGSPDEMARQARSAARQASRAARDAAREANRAARDATREANDAVRDATQQIPFYEQPGKQNKEQNPQGKDAARPAGDAERTAAQTDAKGGRAAGDKSTTDRVLMIIGIVLVCTGILAGTDAITSMIRYGEPMLWLEDLVAGILPLVGGIGMMFGSFRLKASRRMRKKIDNIVGEADSISIREIAAAIPCSYDKCCKYLEDCIDKGLFGDNAYLDMRARCLVVRGHAPEEQPQPAPAQTAEDQAGSSQYHEILEELHRANEAIVDPRMTEKINRLEAVSAKIFAQAEASPAKLPQMRKFMDYYLPTSLKLLQTYAELDAQGIEGENISESKRRIEQSMGTVVVAFENQLDKLFQADAMDVSTDIDVMENMLRADGLAGEDPFDLSAPTGPQPPTLG